MPQSKSCPNTTSQNEGEAPSLETEPSSVSLFLVSGLFCQASSFRVYAMRIDLPDELFFVKSIKLP